LIRAFRLRVQVCVCVCEREGVSVHRGPQRRVCVVETEEYTVSPSVHYAVTSMFALHSVPVSVYVFVFVSGSGSGSVSVPLSLYVYVYVCVYAYLCAYLYSGVNKCISPKTALYFRQRAPLLCKRAPYLYNSTLYSGGSLNERGND